MPTLRIRRGSAASIANSPHILASGEPGYDETNGVLKIGNGSDAWIDLPATRGNVVNVKDYGAVGNGITDDTAALAAAITAANTAGLSVQLKSGETYLTGRLVYSRLHLTCDGSATIKAKPGSTTAGQPFVAATDFRSTRVGFDGNNVVDTLLYAAGTFRMSHGSASNVLGTGAVFARLVWAYSTCTVFEVDSNTFSNVSGVENAVEGDDSGADCGIYIQAPIAFKVRDNTFTSIGGWEDGDAIRVQLAADATLHWAAAHGSLIEGNRFPEIKKRAIKVQGSYVTVRRNYITCTSTDATLCPWSGIELFGSYCVVAGNFIDIERAVACIVDQGVRNSIIDGNYLTFAKSGTQLTGRGSATSAVRYLNATAGRCDGNVVKSNGVAGIYLTASLKCIVSGNEHVIDCPNPTSYVAVYVASASNYCIVSGNTLSGTPANKIRYAVQVDNSTFTRIVNNQFDNCANSGIRYNGTSANCLNAGNSYTPEMNNDVDYTAINTTSAQTIRDLDSDLTAIVEPGTIAAGGQYTQDVTFSPVAAGTKVVASPTTALEAGLTWHAMGVSGNTVRLFIQNCTASPIEAASRTWSIKLAA